MIDSQLHPCFTSASEKWGTPRWLFNELDREFHFTLDVCATAESAKCRRYFSPEDDGLAQEWDGVCWMNPPFGKGVERWVEKAYKSAMRGVMVVCLLPARTDTQWFHDWVYGKADLRFLRGRLEYVGFGGTGAARGAAPFPSMIAVFRAGGGGGFVKPSPAEEKYNSEINEH